MDGFMKQLYDTAFNTDIPIIPNDKCCRLLAWLLIYGVNYEGVTMDIKLNNAIRYAQKRLNIIGGKRPDPELLPIFQDYVKSVPDYKNPPVWVVELEKEYDIKINMR